MNERGVAAGRVRAGRWLFAVLLLLTAWGLRVCCLEDVPPGWRDDELINMHALSGEVLSGSFPLYFTGASGHEPLYHYVQAGVQAILGVNTLSGHLPSAALGLMSVALTYALATRLFDGAVAAIASLALTTSFWSLMYSRVALRHVSVVPFVLLSVYLLWRGHVERGRRKRTYVWLGVATGLAMYTYFASRLIPLILVAYILYLLAFHRDEFRRQWRLIGLALLLALIVVAPMAVTIARGVGADPRIAELAAPIRALMAGDPRPLVDTAVETLGMFTTSGDPEWLYNVPGRPVFNVLGGALLWLGVLACLIRWRRPAYFVVLSWFVVGLAPAFVSIPPASLGHTILAQPAAYILSALATCEARGLVVKLGLRFGQGRQRAGRLGLRISFLLAAAFLATNAHRDLSSYFIDWPRESLVRFLYRADYRDIARYLDGDGNVAHVAVGSTLLGPWDRLALDADSRSDDVHFRLFNPERGLIWVAGASPSRVVITDYPRPGQLLGTLLAARGGPSEQIGLSAFMYELPDVSDLLALFCDPPDESRRIEAHFADGLVLEGLCWVNGRPGGSAAEAWLVTVWRADRAVDMPLAPVTAYPPPPGVYVGPRLAAFAHLVSEDDLPPVVDDGLWVDPSTLEPGDRFVQIHQFEADPDGPDGYSALEIGLYDPFTGERVPVVTSLERSQGDRVVVRLGETNM